MIQFKNKHLAHNTKHIPIDVNETFCDSDGRFTESKKYESKMTSFDFNILLNYLNIILLF